MSEGQRKFAGPLYILAAFFLWSALGVIVRRAGVPVHYLIFYANLLSLVFLGGYLARPSYRDRFPRGIEHLKLMTIGPVALLNSVTYFYALKHTTIANALLTHYVSPVFVAVLAFVFLREPFTKRVLLSIAVASSGLWLLLGMTGSELVALMQSGDRHALGMMSGLFSGLAYAFLIILMRVLAQRNDPIVLTLYQNVMTCLVLAPFIRDFPVHALWSFIVMGIFQSTIAPILYFKGISEVTANRAAILGYFEPVCGILLGALILEEYPTAGAIIGGGLILYSGYLIMVSGAEEKGGVR